MVTPQDPPSHPSPTKGEGTHRRTRLYLVTPQLADPAAFVGDLETVLCEADVAALLLRLDDADERTLINRIKTIAGIVQRRDIALLLDDRPELVARAGADGAHLTGITALQAAIGTLKPDRIAGVGGLRSRHDAMLAGETNADYVMFGEPRRRRFPPSHNGEAEAVADNRPPFDAVVERVQWWAELFQPPCIGYAAEADEIRPLAAAGADFIALGDWIWTHPSGAKIAVKAAVQSLAAASA